MEDNIIIKMGCYLMFSHHLKKLRKNAGLTQSQLAKKLNLTQSTIAYYESGRKMPTLENAKLIAELFNTNLDYLLGISKDKNNQLAATREYPSIADRLCEDINSLSPKSQKDLKNYIKLLKLRDSCKRSGGLDNRCVKLLDILE